MIEITDYSDGATPPRLRVILSRNSGFTPDLETSVDRIVADVRERGDPALIQYTQELDGVSFSADELRVPQAEIQSALDEADAALLQSIEVAADNIRRFHEAQKRASWFIEDGDGVILGKRVLALERVALLIPGASAPLLSTLLMAAIPAQIAGVPHICVATPPRPDGTVHPAVLVAAGILDLQEIYRVFGAQAVAGLAYGTRTLPRVDKLVGPGHPAVQIAKKRVYGDVDIDMVAGPSEIVVVADHTADPRYVAADMLSQAEHGSGFEAAVCITTSRSLAEKVAAELRCQAKDLPHREAIARALDNYGAIVVTRGIGEAIELSNRIAPEHLELIIENPWGQVHSVRNAGAVFLGPDSPESVGDYFAGTNHILPTAGAARFASSVGVETFLKTISVVSYTGERLSKTSDHIVRLSEAEGLAAHAGAIRVRLRPASPSQ